MSVALSRQGGIEPPESLLLTTTGATTIISALGSTIRVVEAITLANISAGAILVTLEWVDATPTSYKFWQKSIAANSVEIIDNIPILLQSTGKVRSLKATAASANTIWATVITSAQTKTGP